jgi:hypothetical protein
VNINLHIEQLVLDGVFVESHQRPLLKASLETELGRLLAQKGIGSSLQSGGAFKTKRTDAVEIGQTGRPSHFGRKIARSVYGGINR